jgi:16S rRNA (cytosine967-C5)-methyltransferase
MQERAARLSRMRHTGAVERLQEVPWDALRADVALPAIARALEGSPAEREVDRALRAHRDLTTDQRRAAVEAIFGVALWRRRLAWETGTASAPDPATLLASLLRDLAGVPEHRAVSLTGLAMAPSKQPPPMRLADRWSLPDWLEAHLLSELGNGAADFCAAVAVPGPVCLRANRLLCTRDALALRLADEGIATAMAARAPDALRVTTPRPNLFGTRAWREGLFEPQDEGSQLLGLLVGAQPGETVLDLCAGAGGKSLLLAAQGARVLAYDVDRERLERLRARAARARAGHIEILDRPRAADHVLVDAPCSELGILRRGPDARWRIDPGTLASLPRLQRELLEVAAPLARKSLVYATCTVNRAENEEVAAAFEHVHPDFGRATTFRTLPHLDGTDGFFGTVWERKSVRARP